MTTPPLPGVVHTLTLTIEPSSVVYAGWGCHAPVGAPCRKTCPEGCESWVGEHEGEGEHGLVDAGHCVATEWLDNDAWDEAYAGPAAILWGYAEVYPVWDGDRYTWSYEPPVVTT